MDVLLVVENNNDVAIWLSDKDGSMVGSGGTNHSSTPVIEAFLRISLKRPPSSYATKREILNLTDGEELMFSKCELRRTEKGLFI